MVPPGARGHPGRATAARGLAIKLHWISSEFGTFKFSTSYVSRRAHFRAPAQHVTRWRFPAAPLAPGPRLPRPLGVLEVHLPKDCDWPRRLRAPSAAGCCLVSQRWLYCSVLVWLLGFLLLCSGSVKCQAGKRGGTGMNYSRKCVSQARVDCGGGNRGRIQGRAARGLVGGGVSVCARVFVCVCVCVCIQDGPEPFLSQYMENQEPWSVSVSFVPEEGETLS